MKLSGKQRGLGEKSQNEIHLPASMHLSTARECSRADGKELVALTGAAVGTQRGRGCPVLFDLQLPRPKRSHKFGVRFHQNCELRFFK